MKNMHLEQTVAIKSDKEIFTSGFEICQTQKWCRAKLCCQLICFLYTVIISCEIKGVPGIVVDGHLINNLRCADDTVINSTSTENKYLLYIRRVKKWDGH